MKKHDSKVESFSAGAKKMMKERRRVGQTCMGSNLSMMIDPKNGSGISTELKKIAALDGIASPVADICTTCRKRSVNTTVVVDVDETALTSDDVAE